MREIRIDERSSTAELTRIFEPHAEALEAIYAAVDRTLPALVGRPALHAVGSTMLGELDGEHPPSGRELRAWAQVTGVKAEVVAGMNAAFSSSAFGCTAGVATTVTGKPMHTRTLDWELPALVGRTLRATYTNDTGTWTSLSYPGLVGQLTVVRRGAYSVSLNHAPFDRRDVLAGVWSGWDPLLALRRAVSEESTYEGLIAALRNVPLTASCIYIVAAADGRGARIERSLNQNTFTESLPVVAANLFDANDSLGAMNEKRDDDDPLVQSSGERAQALRQQLGTSSDPAQLMTALREPPIWNDLTLYAAVMDAAGGMLEVHERRPEVTEPTI